MRQTKEASVAGPGRLVIIEGYGVGESRRSGGILEVLGESGQRALPGRRGRRAREGLLPAERRHIPGGRASKEEGVTVLRRSTTADGDLHPAVGSVSPVESGLARFVGGIGLREVRSRFGALADAAAGVAADTGAMTSAKTYRFPVDVGWAGGRLTQVSVAGKHELRVATPPEFRGGISGVWSPEDLFVAAAATCYVVTLVGVAERRGVPLRALGVHAAGEVTERLDGRFGFVSVDLDVVVETDPGREGDARSAAEAAERGCLVAASLDTPVRVTLDIRAMAAA